MNLKKSLQRYSHSDRSKESSHSRLSQLELPVDLQKKQKRISDKRIYIHDLLVLSVKEKLTKKQKKTEIKVLNYEHDKERAAGSREKPTRDEVRRTTESPLNSGVLSQVSSLDQT